jgi:hypothetical protein
MHHKASQVEHTAFSLVDGKKNDSHSTSMQSREEIDLKKLNGAESKKKKRQGHATSHLLTSLITHHHPNTDELCGTP